MRKEQNMAMKSCCGRMRDPLTQNRTRATGTTNQTATKKGSNHWVSIPDCVKPIGWICFFCVWMMVINDGITSNWCIASHPGFSLLATGKDWVIISHRTAQNQTIVNNLSTFCSALGVQDSPCPPSPLARSVCHRVCGKFLLSGTFILLAFLAVLSSGLLTHNQTLSTNPCKKWGAGLRMRLCKL